MELYSLEDEDYGGLFLTQKDNENAGLGVSEMVMEQESEDEVFFHDKKDAELSVAEGGTVRPLYSDISDAEDDFVNPVYGRGMR